MKQLLSILIFVISCNCVNAQKHDNIWTMGYKYDSCNYYIDFTDSFKIVPTCFGIDFLDSGNAAICDSLGKLLFYTNNYAIADSSHQIMPNGLNLNNSFYSLYETYGYPAESIILPRPRNNNFYNLFHLERQLQSNGSANGLAIQLNHSIVDMSLNNGLGDLSSKNISILTDTIGGWGLSIEANKHANGQDWWILVPEYESNAYYRFLLTEDSIYGPFRQEVGYSFSWLDYNGQTVFSPDGSLYVRYDPQNQAHLYDFNRCTGEMSYRQQINVPSNSNAGGAAISANSRFLYIANDTIVFQYDLQAADINSSRITVALNASFWQMQLAPNGKIYGISLSSSDRLHVIENPDSAGLACNFRQHAIITPRYNSLLLPNFPHFRTPALAAGACDTTGVLVLPVVKEFLKVYPNPANDVLNLEWDSPLETTHTIQIFDVNGRLLQQKETAIGNSFLQLNTTNIPVGLYILRISDNAGNIIANKKIVIVR